MWTVCAARVLLLFENISNSILCIWISVFVTYFIVRVWRSTADRLLAIRILHNMTTITILYYLKIPTLLMLLWRFIPDLRDRKSKSNFMMIARYISEKSKYILKNRIRLFRGTQYSYSQFSIHYRKNLICASVLQPKYRFVVETRVG